MIRARTQLGSAALVALQGVAAPTAAQDGASWSARWSYSEDAAQTVLGQDYRPRQHTVLLRRQFDADTSAIGQHEYRILNLPIVDGEAADTNGHVHRLAFGWQRQAPAWRLQIAAVLAVSSNTLKHLGDLNARDLRPDIAIERNVADAFWFGLRADDRFGRTLVYPSVGWQIQAGPAHALHIGVPDSSWRWRWTQQLEAVLAIAPEGGSWRVRDRVLVRHSDVRARSWHAGWSLRWQPVDALFVEARIGRRFASQLRYLLRDGTAARVDVADCNVFGLSLAARF